jgi:hypothetical protein
VHSGTGFAAYLRAARVGDSPRSVTTAQTRTGRICVHTTSP